MSKAKKRYPDQLPFKLLGFDWVIKFLDTEEVEHHGLTFLDKKLIHIYYNNRDDQNVLETLIHELGHVVMLDMADSVFKHEAEKPFDMEENLIRLASPRIFSVIRDNPKLVEFIIKRIKEL